MSMIDALFTEDDLAIVEFGKPEPDYNHNLFHVYFYGDRIITILTHDSGIVTDWIRETDSNARPLNHLTVGLDIEWRPSYSKQENPVATLQLCVGRRCLIIQLLHCDKIPVALTNFLCNPKYTFVGVGIKKDVEKLEKDHGISVHANVVDLRPLAADKYGDRNLKGAGLKKLCKVVLGIDIEKPKLVTMGRWDKEELNDDQVQYACVDAFVSFKIGKELKAASTH